MAYPRSPLISARTTRGAATVSSLPLALRHCAASSGVRSRLISRSEPTGSADSTRTKPFRPPDGEAIIRPARYRSASSPWPRSRSSSSQRSRYPSETPRASNSSMARFRRHRAQHDGQAGVAVAEPFPDLFLRRPVPGAVILPPLSTSGALVPSSLTGSGAQPARCQRSASRSIGTAAGCSAR